MKQPYTFLRELHKSKRTLRDASYEAVSLFIEIIHNILNGKSIALTANEKNRILASRRKLENIIATRNFEEAREKLYKLCHKLIRYLINPVLPLFKQNEI